MPERKKKVIPTKETGTVPKVKYWKNTSVPHDGQLSNNLSGMMLPNQELVHGDSRNRQGCSNFPCFEEICGGEEPRFLSNYNSLPYMNMSGGTTSPSTSNSTPRRHSGSAIQKCDNIAKYPDKKHIEEKLNQIREYLKVTSSLMNNVKEQQKTRANKSNDNDADDLFQMLSALRDSERKLEALLVNREVDDDVSRSDTVVQDVVHVEEASTNSAPTLDIEPIFPTFQNNITSLRNELEEKMEISEMKLLALHEQQSLLMQLQEKAENQLKDARKVQHKLATCVDKVQYNTEKNRRPDLTSPVPSSQLLSSQQSSDLDSQTAEQLNLLETTNESRGQLLRLLDARDSELCNEQQALQQKMQELSSKKRQIDQLVSQLHNYGNCSGGGGGGGDTTSDDGDEMANQIRQIVAMKEQLATLKDMLSTVKSTEAALHQQNCVDNSDSGDQTTNAKSANNVKKVSSLVLSDIDARSDTERRWNTMGKQSNKSSICSSREQLQAELQAKKQELEELMYKDQDRTSAINQDVCNEIIMNKGDHEFSVDSVPSSWTLLQDTPPRESCVSRENIYSSDEDDLENYSQLNNSDRVKSSDYAHSNYQKQTPNRQELNSNATIQDAASTLSGSQQWSNGIGHKQQIELMTNLCQSLLEQQRPVIPSSQLSVPNMQWYMSYTQMQQALMLSTISQCCQLIWLQQQDINTLISTVNGLQQRVKQPTVNQSTSACSLTTRLPSANTDYASLETRGPSTSTSINHPTRNMSSASGLSQAAAPPPPSPTPHQSQPVWRGPQAAALNNQVAPGNRANNYWDNFRSYSRQNLLSSSTKSNEGSQNSLPICERSNTVGGIPGQTLGVHRPPTISVPKINTPIQESVSPLQMQQETEHTTNRSERAKPTKRNRAPFRNRNEWNETESVPEKTKLCDELRDNVYKEVTLLLSANENRPHFLIQLFRDLQLISSDPLRNSTLQSIQTLITNSLLESASLSNSNQSEKSSSRCCSQPNHGNTVSNYKLLEPETQHILTELVSFLKVHNENVLFGNGLLDMIKMIVFQLLPSKYSSSSNKFHAKLDSVLTETLLKFKGKRVSDIREELLKTIADILLQELSAAKLVKESTNEIMSEALIFPCDTSPRSPFESFQFLSVGDKKSHPNTQRIDNGDLAEADQSRREAEHEEGAVGGVLLNTNTHANSNHVEHDSNELESDFDLFINTGLKR